MTINPAALEAIIDAIVDEHPRYPSGTAFIDASLANYEEIVRAAIDEGRPFVLLLPDGDELLLRPRRDLMSTVLRALFRPRSRRAARAMRPRASGASFELALRTMPGFDARLHLSAGRDQHPDSARRPYAAA